MNKENAPLLDDIFKARLHAFLEEMDWQNFS